MTDDDKTSCYQKGIQMWYKRTQENKHVMLVKDLLALSRSLSNCQHPSMRKLIKYVPHKVQSLADICEIAASG